MFFFGILTKSFRRGYGNCIPRVKEVFWEKKLSVFETKLIFTFYGSEQHNLYFLQKTTLRVFRNHILLFWRTILRIVFETKININFFPVIVIEDQVSYFGDTLLAWMWKRNLFCPEEIFEDKCFAVEKKSISKTYLWTLRNTFRAFCKKNVWSCHSRYLDSIPILRGYVSLKGSCLTLFEAHKRTSYGLLARSFRRGDENCSPNVHGSFLRKKYVLKQN